MASVSNKISDELKPETIIAIRDADVHLRRFIDSFTNTIAQLGKQWSIPFADGSELTAKEFNAVWDKIHFLVVGDAFQPGYGGMFDFPSKVSTIRYSTVLGWGAHSGGLEFIALHEVIHGCEAGDRVRRQQWDAYRKLRKAKHGRKKVRAKDEADWAAQYYSYPQFAEVEEFCNRGARDVAEYFGLPRLLATPTHGFEYGDLTC
ncbi:hypothetical protein HFP57_13210 [Parasphingopyxis algicola]|uniref:hypothetical protein n=1 Tax=Parasphingopyxis algicola TaxID=2026624 RepID=UPI0015A2B505|nr:hypothetical protein [Parasphingopyxis algicola]QLC25889.1 hypothetical protein HFP57_13210 [Parasphingopyxis algicola]